MEARTRDLTARESSCCSFFDFQLTAAGGVVILDVRVPEVRIDVLDGIARVAEAAALARRRRDGVADVSGALRSGQLARAAGVNVQTLRYYERRGLLPEPQRTLGGHREYGAEAVTVLRAIRGLARLGFTLGEIAELVEVGSHRGPRPGLRDAAAAKLTEVEAKIADLQRVRVTLNDVLTAGCRDLTECSCTPGCPIPFADLDRRAAQQRGHRGGPEPPTAVPGES